MFAVLEIFVFGLCVSVSSFTVDHRKQKKKYYDPDSGGGQQGKVKIVFVSLEC